MKIALAGQLGAGCTEVAQIISDKTGVKIFNSESLIRKLIVESSVSFRTLQEYIMSGEVNIDRILESMTLDVVNVEERVVIEGRSALFLLGREDVFKVLLVAEDEFRASRISERRKMTMEEARREIEHSDEERRNLVRRFHGVDWMDPKLYHVVVNTSFRSMEDVADTVLEAYKRLFKS